MSTLLVQVLALMAATLVAFPLAHKIARGPIRPRKVRVVLNQNHGARPVERGLYRR